MTDTERSIRHLKRLGLWPVNECLVLGRAFEAIAWCWRCTVDGLITETDWRGMMAVRAMAMDIMAAW